MNVEWEGGDGLMATGETRTVSLSLSAETRPTRSLDYTNGPTPSILHL